MTNILKIVELIILGLIGVSIVSIVLIDQNLSGALIYAFSASLVYTIFKINLKNKIDSDLNIVLIAPVLVSIITILILSLSNIIISIFNTEEIYIILSNILVFILYAFMIKILNLNEKHIIDINGKKSDFQKKSIDIILSKNFDVKLKNRVEKLIEEINLTLNLDDSSLNSIDEMTYKKIQKLSNHNFEKNFDEIIMNIQKRKDIIKNNK